MAQPNRDSGGSSGSQDIIDDALRLVDSLQRKLIIAGVRRGVSSVTSPPPSKGDVWEEAVKDDTPDEPALDRLFGIARTAAPEVAGHLFKAGTTMFRAAGQTWGVIESAWEKNRRERDENDGGGPNGDGGGSRGDTPPPAITRR
ncbi:hypothetical protein CLV63_122103 [Murinocardiopsis flavida]|uniref:Uncharacterized protein n=1 Tax=Murinocardiopsis flavida TaxID=645275 RepID=A0A2P8D020_9ACTN|nr:hypothetical protein [Murinocardiopsis flavida]PSK90569.1 hypothetical protein CLV63_122103 [Murinocardiopsis flavida]